MAGLETRLQIKIDNTAPVELRDFTRSFQAITDAYEDFVFEKGYDTKAGNVRLYVSELKSGSLIADLVALQDQVTFIIDHLDVYAGFISHVADITQYFFLPRPKGEEDQPSRREANQLNQIIEPVAKDGGSQMFMNINGDHPEISVHFHIDSEQASAAQNNIRRFLGDAPPVTGVFRDEALYLHQVRGEIHSKAGDRGIIEKFSDRPVKLVFANDDAKAKMLEAPFPFGQVFVVDGEVSSVDGKPALYKLYAVKDSFPRPA